MLFRSMLSSLPGAAVSQVKIEGVLHEFSSIPGVKMCIRDSPNDLKKMKSLHGLTRTLINNMVVGVTQGYEKKLEVNGVGYRAAKSGNKLTLSLGYSHPVEMEDPEGRCV